MLWFHFLSAVFAWPTEQPFKVVTFISPKPKTLMRLRPPECHGRQPSVSGIFGEKWIVDLTKFVVPLVPVPSVYIWIRKANFNNAMIRGKGPTNSVTLPFTNQFSKAPSRDQHRRSVLFSITLMMAYKG